MNSQSRIGDIIEIPLTNGKKAFAHYLARDSWGDLIGVFDYLTDIDEEIDITKLRTKKLIFPPILTRVQAGMELSQQLMNNDKVSEAGISLSDIDIKMASNKNVNYNWKIIGNLPIKNFTFPNFLWKNGGPTPAHIRSKWYLYDGKKDIELGTSIPQKYRNLEFLTNYTPTSVVERILTGKKPKEKLIKQSTSIFYRLLSRIFQ